MHVWRIVLTISLWCIVQLFFVFYLSEFSREQGLNQGDVIPRVKRNPPARVRDQSPSQPFKQKARQGNNQKAKKNEDLKEKKRGSNSRRKKPKKPKGSKKDGPKKPKFAHTAAKKTKTKDMSPKNKKKNKGKALRLENVVKVASPPAPKKGPVLFEPPFIKAMSTEREKKYLSTTRSSSTMIFEPVLTKTPSIVEVPKSTILEQNLRGTSRNTSIETATTNFDQNLENFFNSTQGGGMTMSLMEVQTTSESTTSETTSNYDLNLENIFTSTQGGVNAITLIEEQTTLEQSSSESPKNATCPEVPSLDISQPFHDVLYDRNVDEINAKQRSFAKKFSAILGQIEFYMPDPKFRRTTLSHLAFKGYFERLQFSRVATSEMLNEKAIAKNTQDTTLDCRFKKTFSRLFDLKKLISLLIMSLPWSSVEVLDDSITREMLESYLFKMAKNLFDVPCNKCYRKVNKRCVEIFFCQDGSSPNFIIPPPYILP